MTQETRRDPGGPARDRRRGAGNRGLDPKLLSFGLFALLVLLVAIALIVIVPGGSVPTGLSGLTSPSSEPTERTAGATPDATAPAAAVDSTASPIESASEAPDATTAPAIAPTASATASKATPRPMSGDRVADSIAIDRLPYALRLSTAGATSEPEDPECAMGGPTVWFAYRAATSADLAATTIGSDYDTTLVVLSRHPDGTTSVVVCNDDATESATSVVRFGASSGATYLFAVGALGTGRNLTFNLGLAPPVPELSVTIDEAGIFTEEGRATISGVFSCSAPMSRVSISVSMRQVVGRSVFEGEGYADGWECRTAHAFGMTVASEDGTFGSEPATVTVVGSGCSKLDCVTTQASAIVTLASILGTPSPPPSTPNPTPSPSPSPTP